MYKIGFIGCGNIGGAMIGKLADGMIENEKIAAYDVNSALLDSVCKANKITALSSNKEIASSCEMLVLSVKPFYYDAVIDEIKDVIWPNCVVITVAAGYPLQRTQNAFGKEVKVIRTMPNTPVLVGEGMIAYCPNPYVTKDEEQLAAQYLSAMGKAEKVEEKLMDAVVGVSGSAPAYVFMLIDAMADAAVRAGMPRTQAIRFAAQAVLGSAKMVLDTGRHPDDLKDMVCTPGGTTIEAVAVLEQEGFRGAVIDAIKACVDKAAGK